MTHPNIASHRSATFALVPRLVAETDHHYQERSVEPYGGPVRRADEQLEARGYAIGHGGCCP